MRCLATICTGGLVARIRCMCADNTRLGVGLALACLSCAEKTWTEALIRMSPLADRGDRLSKPCGTWLFPRVRMAKTGQEMSDEVLRRHPVAS